MPFSPEAPAELDPGLSGCAPLLSLSLLPQGLVSSSSSPLEPPALFQALPHLGLVEGNTVRLWQGSSSFAAFRGTALLGSMSFYLSFALGISNTHLSCGGGGLVAKSCPTLATPWTVACQAPLSVGFSRQESQLRTH